MKQKRDFECRAALQRLVSRHPLLATHPDVARVLAQGSNAEESSVLEIVQELVLCPDVSVACLGCFRPVLAQVLDSLLYSLKVLWRQGKSYSGGNKKKGGEWVGISSRLRNGGGWDLGLHEFTVVLFSRLLELAPYLLSSFLQYFEFAPSPFERLLHGGSAIYESLVSSSKVVPFVSEAPAFIQVIWASYRLLRQEPKIFRELWDWSPFLDLLRLTPKTLDEESLDVRWCGVQIISLVLQMSNTATLELSSTVARLTEKDSFSCHLRGKKLSQEIAVERAGMYLERNDDEELIDAVETSDSRYDWDLSNAKSWGGTKRFHLQICGIELPIRQISREGRAFPLPNHAFVLTPTVKRNLEAVVLALSQRHPVLLEGPIGSGKSSLIQELASTTGNWDLLFIHLDDQMDSKTLLGNYACTEIPGEFKWQPGALTQAVVRGMWVVFEDFDRAPFEIFSALIPLLEDRKLYIPGRGEMIPAADNFRLFATVTRTRHGGVASGGKKDMLGNLWRKVVVDEPSDEELADIMRVRFPSLTLLVPKMIGTLNLVKHIASQSKAAPAHGFPDVSIYIGRQFSTRDLFKWCTRVSSLGPQALGGSVLSGAVRERIYVEGADCFAASIANAADRQLVMSAIGEYWNVPMDRVNFYASLNKSSCQMTTLALHVGRATLHMQSKRAKPELTRVFAYTGHAVRTLEAIAMCVQEQEPVLLVGETGTGKTSLVQHLAWQLGVSLTVLNMSQQTDSTDFLGGFKPVEAQGVCIPLFETFNVLFRDTFPKKKNAQLLEHVQQFAEKRKWDRLLSAFQSVIGTVSKLLGASLEVSEVDDLQRNVSIDVVKQAANGHSEEEQRSKRKRPLNSSLLKRWQAFTSDLHKAERQVEAAKTGFAFSFVEGVLVKAIREGHWLLLDEINLAPVETLERLTGVLEGAGGTLSLTERGDVENVFRHSNFRIFGCMNPATDFGKRDLPISLRNRFTELYVDELTQKEDLHALVFQFLENTIPSPPVEDIVNFYLQARHEAETRLLDGANQKPQYSLRSLARALEYTCAAMSTYGFHRSLYDGICMSFLTLLDRPSALIMEQIINSSLFKITGAAATKALKALFKVPPQPSPAHVLFEHFWVESGNAQLMSLSQELKDRYVCTKTIMEHLKNLARAVFVRKYPVLLQGPTSSGKTSLVEYLATTTGHRFVRINNHEHTDLQEYFGSYVTDSSGKLVFQEGILVEAVRKGYWIVLDELNLAPSDVLEALNRLLDDNRELFVPELQITVKPHPHFMLFATQNPPGIYGGRKVLSRAFRNRFMELHVDDIPDDELCMILEKRCQIPGSYAKKMIEVMKDLQRHRQGSKVFAGKHGFITARDLFRWAERHGNGYEELARDGYMLLAERLRNAEEKEVVQRVLEKHMRVKIDVDQLHELGGSKALQAAKVFLESEEHVLSFGRIVWTKSMKRLFNLVEHCIRHCEPVLLVGETGCGKTMICQLLSLLLKQKLHILNCHQHTETSDFLGGLRPVRERESLATKFKKTAERVASLEIISKHCPDKISFKIDDAATTIALIKSALSDMKKWKQDDENLAKSLHIVEEALYELSTYHKDWQSLFVWHDGPLVQAMRDGDMFLVDEISLADDSVLERLNSVLEPKRLLVLAEKGGAIVEELIANPSFRLLATMNPGGDFGKKELSPALRNRFTEIWVPPISDIEDLRSIVLDRFLVPELTSLAGPMLQFWQWFQHHHEGGRSLSIRDLLAWITYINIADTQIGKIPAFIHGAFLVLLDGIGFGTGLSNSVAQQLQTDCANYLFDQLSEDEKHIAIEAIQPKDDKFGCLDVSAMEVGGSSHGNIFGLHPFFILRGDHTLPQISFALDAPTTKRNAWKILRAMQLPKPILLEGSPGVGKTSLVAALAAASGHALVRINLSEQTDIMDLLGSDLPVEGGTGADFQWSDGVFLQALKSGHWVLLDELNLASQSVLEGLNACLDHRGELFIPELGRSFKCPPTFRVFACQNPLSQGGGRKGLPKSFLNRFTKVYMDALSSDDFLDIASILHPSIPKSILVKMIGFNARLYHETMIAHSYGNSGAPWEFNLRDILRWCELMEGSHDCQPDSVTDIYSPQHFLDVIYLQRMRTIDDRCRVLSLFQEVFGTVFEINTFPGITVHPDILQVGLASLDRRDGPWLQGHLAKQLQLLPGLSNRMEAAMHCVSKGWMCILVGPPATGKTSLVRLMAALTGNSLHEFALSSATDTTELLGCFEQHDPFRQWQDIVKRTYDSLKTICSFCLSVNEGALQAEVKLNLVKNLFGSWTAFQKCSHNPVARLEQHIEQGAIDLVAVNMILQILEQLSQVVTSSGMSIEDIDLDPRCLTQRALELKSNIGQFGNAGHFEWVDGGLLKAVERGEWVVLENANFCNPTVLDRLNPLLEPGGSIMINERGLVNGEPMVVQAHPNFRLFLTIDPAHGEVSRAMRNRGVELFMLQPDWSLSKSEKSPILEDLLGGPNTADLDSLKILIQPGVPSSILIQGMCKTHIDLQKLTEVTHSGLPVSLRELHAWVMLLQQLLERGGDLLWSLKCSWEQTYARRLDSVEVREQALEKFHARLGSVDLMNVMNWRHVALSTPGGWPTPITLIDYCLNSKEAVITRDSGFLEFLGSQSCAVGAQKEWQSSENRQNPLKLTQGNTASVAHLPASLVFCFLNPGKFSSKDHPLPQFNSQDVDSMLLFASLWLMEQVSCADFNLRLQWLKNFTANLQVPSNVLNRVVAALEHERVHPLSIELHSVEESRRKLKWIKVARRIEILRRSLLQWEKEDEAYKISDELSPHSTCGPVVQSYWQHKHRAERSRISSTQLPRAMLIYLYALFSSLRKVENEVLISSITCEWDVKLERAFLTLQEWHEALWQNLSTPKFDVEGFLFHWSLLKRSLQLLFNLLCTAGVSASKAEEEIKGLCRLIDEPFALGENPLSKPLLWKFGGHPELLHSKDGQDLELQVMGICQDLWSSGVQEGNMIICADSKLRQLAMTGLSIIRWLGHDTTMTSSDGAPPNHTVHLESLEMYQLLKERIEQEKTAIIPLRNHDIIPLSTKLARVAGSQKTQPSQTLWLPSFPLDLLRWPSAWALWAQLLPWLSDISVGEDTKLLSDLSLLVTTAFHSEEELLGALKEKVAEGTLKQMISFGISCSSRSPVDLVPHQHLLWLLDGTHPSQTNVLTAFRDTVHELWVRWHSALWTNMSMSQDPSEIRFTNLGPARIFHAAQTVHLTYLLGHTGPVRDHHAKLTQLRVAASHLWDQGKCGSVDVFELILSSSSALFQQIVIAHQKSFSDADFRILVSILVSLRLAVFANKDGLLENEAVIVEDLRHVLQQSSHVELLNVLELLIIPLVRLLYFTTWKSLDCGQSLVYQGRVWLLLGELRLRLLLPADGCDPVSKYRHKYAHVTSKLNDLDIEINTRRESEYLVRGSRHSPQILELLTVLEDMKREGNALLKKVIPRPNPPRYRDFIGQVVGFIMSSVDNGRLAVLSSDTYLDLQNGTHTPQEVSTWQDNAIQFIRHLSSAYPAYRDAVQPVQLAVYEMMLGLSLVQEGRIQTVTFGKNGVSLGEKAFMELLCTLMQFPTLRGDGSVGDVGQGGLTSCTQIVTNASEEIISQVANSLVSGPVHSEVLDLELKVMVLRVALLRIGLNIKQGRIKGKDVLKLAENIFDTLASLWAEIRDRQLARNKEDDEFIRFTARTHTMETEAELDEISFREMFVDFRAEFPGYDDDTAMASAEVDDRKAEAALKEKEKASDEGKQRLDKAWLAIQEPLTQDVVAVHRQIFSCTLKCSDILDEILVSDVERENAFSLAYKAGVTLIRAVGDRVPIKLDGLIVASHVLQVGLEHKKVGLLRQSQPEGRHPRYDIYKDPNPPEMALMLEPLGRFLERVGGLLAEWPEHPILLQFLNIAKALVGISLEAPIMKALTGVELLLSKAQLWEENSAKHVSLAGEMNEMMKLVRRWRKLELESWPSLLDCTLEKHERSAESLWFFLHGLLHRQWADDMDKEIEDTISSLEEFMQTSPLGEFQRRLDLLHSFYGQFTIEEAYNAPHAGASQTSVRMIAHILYNVHEYYSQFLIAVEEAVSLGKAPLEKELKSFVKLTKWEDRGYYALALSAEKTHRKLHNIRRRYDELLKKPVLDLLTRQSVRMGTQTLASLTTSVLPTDVEHELSKDSNGNDEKLKSTFKPPASDVTSTFSEWNQYCEIKVAQLKLLVFSEIPLGVPGALKRLPTLTSKICKFIGVGVFEMGCRRVQEDSVNMLEEFSTSVISRSAELRKGEKRLAVKKKALIDLLKALKEVGLSHHKSAVPKEQRNTKNWFQQPAFDVAEVLTPLSPVVDTLGDGGINAKIIAGSIESVCSMWTRAKTYYFQNVALMQRLKQNALNFNKALSLREVEFSTKYMEHLLFLQRKQRQTAFEFSSKLSLLQNLSTLLSGFAGPGICFPQQRALRRWMWQQKGFLDTVCHTMAELCLLFKTAEASQRSLSEVGQITEAGPLSIILSRLLNSLQGCKNVLDELLVPNSRSVKGQSSLEDAWPLVITPAMQKVLADNFAAVKSTECAIKELCERLDSSRIPGLSTLQHLLIKGRELSEKFEELIMSLDKVETSEKRGAAGLVSFTEHYEKTVSEVLLAVQDLRMNTTNNNVENSVPSSEEGQIELMGTIQDIDHSISKKMVALRFGQICDSIMRTILAGADTMDMDGSHGSDTGMALGQLLGSISVPLQIIQAAGAQLLSDYVTLQKSVSKLGYILSNLFCALYMEGFCLTKEEEGEAGGTKFEDADGTGMGEGEGKKDVSDQIEDEDQLLGSTEKNEDAPTTDAGEKKEKGIEMEQDFAADMLDLSDDDTDEENEQEENEEKLESQMGEEGEKSEVVDEQLWNGEDENDEKQQEGKEKHEKDAPMSGAEGDDLQLRAKEEENEGGKGENPSEDKEDKEKTAAEPPSGQQEKDQPENGVDEEAGLNEDEAYEDPTGIKPRVEEDLELPDDLNLDGGMEEEEGQEGDQEEEMDGGLDRDGENKDGSNEPEPMDVDDENSKAADDEINDEGSNEQERKQEVEDVAADQEEADPGMELDTEKMGMEDEKKSEDANVDGNEQRGEGPSNNEAMAEQPELLPPETTQDLASDSRATGGAEAVPSGVSGARGDPVTTGQDEDDEKMGDAEAQPDQSVSEMQSSALEDQQGKQRSSDSKSVPSDSVSKKSDKIEASPHRRLGDALKTWKEMVQLLDTTTAPNMDMAEKDEQGQEEKTGMTYEFVSKEEKGNAQALGAATDDQLAQTQGLEGLDSEDKNEIPDDKLEPSLEELRLEDDIDTNDDVDEVEATHHPMNMKKGRSADAKKSLTSQSEELVNENLTLPGLEELNQEVVEGRKGNDSLVSLKASSSLTGVGSKRLEEPAVQLLTEEELRDIRKDLEVKIHEGDGSLENARMIWQTLEQLTVRLSQDLAEQLRLILEPTLAAKLQGDYRSGKRINMKKIIPYVASQFRKDKIWLRRTKASKRQYQVVLAIDDSRSMSESHCGHMALEALITICKAMSQLEIGEMAVTSFGEKGNVRLLHDFDQPFSTEAGLNMVSRFTFKQDNTIADEPMVDLLHYLTRMLDFAAKNAVAPSGRNDLQQLVLVIADGRFHEKESLRRCIREATNRKQLLAFLVLDNPKESILDVQSVSFTSGAPPVFSNYLDDFPFPYYILLRDIESLPRTLADLLRQWFELMQRSG